MQSDDEISVVMNWARTVTAKQEHLDMIDRVEALARRGAATAWRPIEKAPKDGTRILITSSGTGQWPIVGKWCGNYWGLDQPRLGITEYFIPLAAIGTPEDRT